MFRIRYIFLPLTFFVLGNDCYYLFKSSDNGIQMMPEEFKLVYKQIADPLKRLAEMLPDHNVEVQLEMLGSDRTPVQTTRLSFMHYRKPQTDNIRLREYDPDRENSSPEIRVKSHSTTTSTTQPPSPSPAQVQYQQQQMQQIQPYVFTLPPGYNQVQPSFQRLNRFDRFNPALFIRQQAESGAATNVASENASPPAIGEASPQQQASEAGQQADETQGKKPVYMADLKKALDEFEKKFFAKQNEKKLVPEEKGNAIEEAKRPLLKKDLWMAMGLKFMTGCPNAHEHFGQEHDANVSIVPIGTTRGMIKIMGPESQAAGHNPMDPKVMRIMQLLKAGVKVDRYKPNENNLQWLQVKIPKRH